MSDFNPILNNPYEAPKKHYETLLDGSLDYEKKNNGRRPYIPFLAPVPTSANKQAQIFNADSNKSSFENHIINLIRKEVEDWRNKVYPNITRVSKELLKFWFLNPERPDYKKLFFAQREAIETTIWLNEVAPSTNQGTNLLNQIHIGNSITGNQEISLPRIAFKMATGTGKTVVMAMQILYHFFNRLEYRGDIRFADYFLIVTPGVTIKDRLSVLRVDTETTNKNYAKDYYRERDLVPQNFEDQLANLNSRIIITNYHTFEKRNLKGNKKSPFDGKKNKDFDDKEDYNLTLKRVIGKFKTGSRLLIINDEAHHCYYPKGKGKNSEEGNSAEENQRAAVWYNGLIQASKKYQVKNIYDLSATPYFISGSGYEAYSLFPWVVSDFGLIDSIESGLVKIPFIPESDTTQRIDEPVLKNIYENVKDQLPKKGKRSSKKAGEEFFGHPQLPDLVKNALEQLYSHYLKSEKELRTIYDSPPVMIIVCNNTNVSSEVFKYIAGYEFEDKKGNVHIVNGKFDLFDNYTTEPKILKAKPPSILIDSDALENSNQINDSFKKIFAPEIERFKIDYRRTHPDKSVENIDESDLLREVVNTVGKPGMLGGNIRCVVSVAMLTEGWDANTVTHIMGIRAFGSQLLCEQVAGRALRRKVYRLDKSGKFTPEYAQIIGVPFNFFKPGANVTPPPPVDLTKIQALKEREQKFEITFPNIVGYRIESISKSIKADFSKVPMYEIDGSKEPVKTTMANAFSSEKDELTVDRLRKIREQELIFHLTAHLLKSKFSDDPQNVEFQYFDEVRNIVKEWLDTKVKVIGDAFKNMLIYKNINNICDHIYKGVEAERVKSDKILPVFNYYNKFGSTKHVYGSTSRKVYATKKSHVNFVVADTDSWEQIAAKSFEEMKEVISYVKNAFLDFKIPYSKEGKENPFYIPDFILRCKLKNKIINLIVEITGFNQDKDIKKWFVENRWLPAVNNVRDKYNFDEWHFIEIAGDIRDIKNIITEKLKTI